MTLLLIGLRKCVIDGWMDGWMDGRMDDGHASRWMDGQVDKWTDGRVNGQTDGWISNDNIISARVFTVCFVNNIVCFYELKIYV